MGGVGSIAPGRNACAAGNLTKGVSPAKVDSWAFDLADSTPIGACDSRILELQLQFVRNCGEGFSARLYACKSSRGFLRRLTHLPCLHRAHSGTSGLRIPDWVLPEIHANA